jgi:hypothetical protein
LAENSANECGKENRLYWDGPLTGIVEKIKLCRTIVEKFFK